MSLRRGNRRLSGHRVEISLEWNMINTYQGLILPLIASASATFLFRQFFLTVPDELARGGPARRRLGRCGSSGRSCCRSRAPNIVALSIILFLYGWNQYLWPLLFTTDKDMATAIFIDFSTTFTADYYTIKTTNKTFIQNVHPHEPSFELT